MRKNRGTSLSRFPRRCESNASLLSAPIVSRWGLATPRAMFQPEELGWAGLCGEGGGGSRQAFAVEWRGRARSATLDLEFDDKQQDINNVHAL